MRISRALLPAGILALIAAGCEVLPPPQSYPPRQPAPRAETPAPRSEAPAPRSEAPTPRAETPAPSAPEPSPQARTRDPAARTPEPATSPRQRPQATPQAHSFTQDQIARLFVARITPVRRGSAATVGLDPDIAAGGWDAFIERELDDLRAFYGSRLSMATVIVVRPFGTFGGIFEADVPARARQAGRDGVYNGMVAAYQRLADAVGTMILYVGAPDNHPDDMSTDDPAPAWVRIDQTTAVFRQIRGARRNVGVGLDASAKWGQDSLSWQWAHRLRDEGFWPIVYEATGPAGNPWNATDMWCIARDATLKKREEMAAFAKPQSIRGPVLHGFQLADEPTADDVLAIFHVRTHEARAYTTLAQMRRVGITSLADLTTKVNAHSP